MNVILLSGGVGKRLWPLSDDTHPKQFLKILETEDGKKESMLQRMVRGIKKADSRATIIVSTHQSQAMEAWRQLTALEKDHPAAAQAPSTPRKLAEGSIASAEGMRNAITGNGDIYVCAEPLRKNTFPAAVLSTTYLHDVLGVSDEEPAILCPVDAYVGDSFFETLKELSDLADQSDSNLCLLGIVPSAPSSQYGYIIPEKPITLPAIEGFNEEDQAASMKRFEEKASQADAGNAFNKKASQLAAVKSFKEKPDRMLAQTYLEQGGLWNSGVYAFRPGYLLSAAHKMIDFSDFRDLLGKYDMLPGISFEYAVAEKEKKMDVMRLSGLWKDLGNWESIREAADECIVCLPGEENNSHSRKMSA